MQKLQSNTLESHFLQILKAALSGEKAEPQNLSADEWKKLFEMAETHKVFPMFYEAVFHLPELKEMDAQMLGNLKRQVVRQVMIQTVKTDQFLSLNRHLQEAGIKPLVVKGIICRNLYPNPDCRQSGDEDVLIRKEDFPKCHEAMLAFGMQMSDPEQDKDAAYEVPYGKMGSPLYIELHKSLFPPESEAYGDLNRYFEHVFDRAAQEEIQGAKVYTLGYTEHLFYLICHAFKHFLHSGFGIRQVCDIVMFANVYGSKIDWEEVLKNCQEIHADVFAAALFRMGSNYLVFDPERACYPQAWSNIKVDETNMLHDLLSGGIYGGAQMSRKHSSNITLEAVAAQKQGRKAGNVWWSSVFPSAKKLEGRYPYLKKHPYLLPAAWAARILKYRKETAVIADNNASDAIKIGNQRIELMKEYGIIRK